MRSNPVLWASIAWVSVLGAHTFFIRPIMGAAATTWILAAAPMLAIALKPRHIKSCIIAAGFVITVYAAGVLFQEMADVRYTDGWELHTGRSWPVLDPNNGALIINFGLIGAFYTMLRNIRWLPLVALFVYAIIITHSRAGLLFSGLACFILLCDRLRFRARDIFLIAIIPLLILSIGIFPSILDGPISALHYRIPIWEGAAKMITPLGLGVGSYSAYYPLVSMETDSGGWYAHNDLLQIFIETGYLGLIAASSLLASVIFTTNKRNILPACMLLTAFLQAMVEFQFYVPSISILTGIALAWHKQSQEYLWPYLQR